MPTFKKKKSGRGSWRVEDMKKAMESVLVAKMSVREAADRFNLPKSSLQDRISKIRKGSEVHVPPKLGRFERTFTVEYEEELANHIKSLDDRLMPLTCQEFLKLAFSLAEELKVPHRFNREKGMAGKDFYYDFMKRHPQLSLRTPESTSLMRAVGFNKPHVSIFFSRLREIMNKHQFPPSKIYNADETGVSCVHENSKVISVKGKRQVGKLTSGERGRNIIVMFCMNAGGQFIPPFIIYPRQKMNARLMIGAPVESQGVAQPNGWMNGDIFLIWLKHFVKYAHPTKESPALLILDGHCSHKELQVILYARANHVHMLSTPPHTTHKLQPLDRTFMKPFKGAYAEACASWMRANPGLRINEYDVAELISVAYSMVCQMEIAQKGFSCTGIFPMNQDVFSDLDYLPSHLTEIPQTGENSGTVDGSRGLETTENSVHIEEVPLESSKPEAVEDNGGHVEKILKRISPIPDASKRRLQSRKRKAE